MSGYELINLHESIAKIYLFLFIISSNVARVSGGWDKKWNLPPIFQIFFLRISQMAGPKPIEVVFFISEKQKQKTKQNKTKQSKTEQHKTKTKNTKKSSAHFHTFSWYFSYIYKV